MELLAEITRLIMTDKGLDRYAEIVAETDIEQCGIDLCLLECDKYVRKQITPNVVTTVKEKTDGR
jgi:hypothetical protein|tara:strand:- start:866 stop:1060 length:195 start_codon:yes stop_codon:yes gene_type:complete